VSTLPVTDSFQTQYQYYFWKVIGTAWVSRSLMSVSDNCVLPTLVDSRTRSSFGDRTFAAAGPQVWNSLPPNPTLCGLKTFYSNSEATAQYKPFLTAPTTFLTYLLSNIISSPQRQPARYCLWSHVFVALFVILFVNNVTRKKRIQLSS